MSNLVVTRTRHDETNNYLFYYAGEAIETIKRKGLCNVIDLKEKHANRKELEGVLKKVQPEIIYLNGHGSNEVVSGYDNEPIVSLGENESILSGAIVYALACSSATKLGHGSVKSGAKAYIGYKEPFIFFQDQRYSTLPLRDATARLYLGPSNVLVVALAKGNTPKVARERSQQEYRKCISRLMSSESSAGEKTHLPFLVSDMTSQVCIE